MTWEEAAAIAAIATIVLAVAHRLLGAGELLGTLKQVRDELRSVANDVRTLRRDLHDQGTDTASLRATVEQMDKRVAAIERRFAEPESPAVTAAKPRRRVTRG